LAEEIHFVDEIASRGEGCGGFNFIQACLDFICAADFIPLGAI
jgi:hypothetical protein